MSNRAGGIENPLIPKLRALCYKARVHSLFFRLILALLLLVADCLALPSPARAQSATESSEAQTLPKVILHIGKATLNTEIAATESEREIGMMHRDHVADNDGMIFLMPTITTATFWMKDTLIPLSIAFIDKNGVILDIHDMKALDETITRSDNDQVAYALETNLHWFSLNGIKPGDKLDPPPSTLAKPANL